MGHFPIKISRYYFHKLDGKVAVEYRARKVYDTRAEDARAEDGKAVDARAGVFTKGGH